MRIILPRNGRLSDTYALRLCGQTSCLMFISLQQHQNEVIDWTNERMNTSKDSSSAPLRPPSWIVPITEDDQTGHCYSCIITLRLNNPLLQPDVTSSSPFHTSSGPMINVLSCVVSIAKTMRLPTLQVLSTPAQSLWRCFSIVWHCDQNHPGLRSAQANKPASSMLVDGPRGHIYPRQIEASIPLKHRG